MDQRFLDYLTRYKENYVFAETECRQSEVCGVRITVTLYEYETGTEYRSFARILLEKDGLCYECEGIERIRWEFFPVTVDGRACIFFSKTLYGFTLIDPDTLTEITDFFPERVYGGVESFIITHAQTFGKYLILDGCYWGAPFEFAALDPVQMRFVSFTEAYGVLAGDQTAAVAGDTLILLQGTSPDGQPVEITTTEQAIDCLMAESGTDDF